MRTVSMPVFSFNELYGSAKERAKYDHNATVGFSSEEDYLNSLKALARHFGASLIDYSIDWGGGTYSEWKFAADDDLSAEEIHDRLTQLGEFNPDSLRGLGDCKLTGFCADESAIDGFRIAFMRDGITSLKSLLNYAAKSLLEDAQDEYRGEYEDENFAEYCDINSLEFHKDGRLYAA